MSSTKKTSLLRRLRETLSVRTNRSLLSHKTNAAQSSPSSILDFDEYVSQEKNNDKDTIKERSKGEVAVVTDSFVDETVYEDARESPTMSATIHEEEEEEEDHKEEEETTTTTMDVPSFVETKEDVVSTMTFPQDDLTTCPSPSSSSVIKEGDCVEIVKGTNIKMYKGMKGIVVQATETFLHIELDKTGEIIKRMHKSVRLVGVAAEKASKEKDHSDEDDEESKLTAQPEKKVQESFRAGVRVEIVGGTKLATYKGMKGVVASVGETYVQVVLDETGENVKRMRKSLRIVEDEAVPTDTEASVGTDASVTDDESMIDLVTRDSQSLVDSETTRTEESSSLTTRDENETTKNGESVTTTSTEMDEPSAQVPSDKDNVSVNVETKGDRGSDQRHSETLPSNDNVRVEIIGGSNAKKYKGMKGTVVKFGAFYITVELDGSNEIIRRTQKNLRFGQPSTVSDARQHNVTTSAHEKVDAPVGQRVTKGARSKSNRRHVSADESFEKIGRRVQIVRGKQKGQEGVIIGLTASGKSWYIQLDGEAKPVAKRPDLLREVGDGEVLKARYRSSDGSSWRVVGSQKEKTKKFGQWFQSKTRLSLSNDSEVNMLGELFQNRLEPVYEVPLGNSIPVQPTIESDGSSLELVSTKIAQDPESNSIGNYRGNKKIAKVLYVRTRGPGLPSISVEGELLKLGNFKVLPARKVKARLELLQSTAHVMKDFPTKGNDQTCLWYFDASNFEIVKERGQNGCGFISEEFMEVLFGYEAVNIDAIQVRIFIPTKGIFKGMLCKKRTVPGQPPIELPESMLKVPPSTDPAHNEAALLVNQFKLHPSLTNRKVHKLLDPSQKDPSFEPKDLNDRSRMVLRLWEGVGVPRALCDEYAERSTVASKRQSRLSKALTIKESRVPKGLKHGWPVGVADPTYSLPVGHVFVPGLQWQPDSLTEVFVTRSPCVKPEHGRKIPLVRNRPDGMTQEDWDFLNRFSFGVIVFANPKEGTMSIPEQIANGDNDGDLFFVCWDEEILEHMTRCERLSEIAVPEDHTKLSVGESRPDWLTSAQSMMADVETADQMSRLTSILYNQMQKLQDDADLNDPDARAFADAYVKALEYEKHGGQIPLPSHLHERIPLLLRNLVTDHGESSESG